MNKIAPLGLSRREGGVRWAARCPPPSPEEGGKGSGPLPFFTKLPCPLPPDPTSPSAQVQAPQPPPNPFPTPASPHSRNCLLYTSPSPRDGLLSRMPSSA